MVRRLVVRLARSALVLVVVSVLSFGLIWLVPGNPASTLAGEFPSPEDIAKIETQLGLDDPVIVQYARWVGDAVQGDLGESLRSGRSVSGEIWARLPVTLSLTGFAVVFSVIISLPLGIIAALKQHSIIDRLLTVLSTVGVAFPSFFIGIVLVALIALRTTVLPATGYVGPSSNVADWIAHCTLPGIALGLASAAELTRQFRSALIGVLRTDYIRTARAKGIPGWMVIAKHASKNSAIPLITVLGAQVAVMLGGSIVIELIFSMPGLGRLAIGAVTTRDIPVIQGVVLVSGCLVLFVNTMVDLSYGLLDPRTRQQ